MYDLVIIGSGQADLSAAVYAKRACLDVVVLADGWRTDDLYAGS